jgi:hypothetical protein
MNMVLKLSADAPANWRRTFGEAWKPRSLAMGRKAVIEDNTLTSTCMTYELQGQINQLNEVISATNEPGRHIAEQVAASQDAELKNLKGSLRYD